LSLPHEDYDEDVDLDYEQVEEDDDEDDDDEESEVDEAGEEEEVAKDEYEEEEDEDYVAPDDDEEDDDGEGDDDDEDDDEEEGSGMAKVEKVGEYAKGTNWVEGGLDKSYFLYLVLLAPFICQVLAYVTSDAFSGAPPTLSRLVAASMADPQQVGQDLLGAIFSGLPTARAVQFLLCFNGLALVLECILPGKTQTGPETLTGHIPEYKDNGFLHCIFFTLIFFTASDVGYLNLFELGVVFDEFVPIVTTLNLFGISFSVLLYFKGLYFPSTQDSGSSGSLMTDFL
jgi:hypothetical protein